MSTIKCLILCALMSAGFASHAHAATCGSSEECLPPGEIGCISWCNVFQAGHAVGQPLCGPEQAVPYEQVVGVCDTACQQGAPVKAGAQTLDVCMNYSEPVTALVGILPQDFSAIQWLRADDCSFSDNFQVAMDGSQHLSCSDVQVTEAFRQGWIFWLVAPTANADLGSDEWWNTGAYELKFY